MEMTVVRRYAAFSAWVRVPAQFRRFRNRSSSSKRNPSPRRISADTRKEASLSATNEEHLPKWSSISGWAGTCHARCQVIRCADSTEASQQAKESKLWLPRGAGCSYGDAAILDQGHLLLLDRPQVSETSSENSDSVIVSSALTLRNLLSTLASEGLTLPVVPGVLDATVGGLIAADAHGKNHLNRGSFRDITDSFQVLLSSGEVVDCDRSHNQELFEGTIGGVGLTGMILAAQLQVIPFAGPRALVEVTSTPDLETSLEQLHRQAQRQEHVAAWIDPTPSGAAFGRGIVVAGTPVTGSENEKTAWNLSRGCPFPPGLGRMLTPRTLRWHNQLRHGFTRGGDHSRPWKLDQLLFPLERWSNWKRLYQPRGFHQHQSLLPPGSSPQAIRNLLKMACSGALEPTLVVAKCMRSGGGWLSFPDQGITLTMDIRADQDSENLLRRLNEEVADQGGKVYLAKDSTLTPGLLARMYPDLSRFRDLRQRIDPDRKIASNLSRRLDL